MEAEAAEKLNVWIDRWEDIVDFEIIPILSSQEYWSQFNESNSSQMPD